MERPHEARLGLLKQPGGDRMVSVDPICDLFRIAELHLRRGYGDVGLGKTPPDLIDALLNVLPRVGFCAHHDVGAAHLDRRSDHRLRLAIRPDHFRSRLSWRDRTRLKLKLVQATRQTGSAVRTSFPFDPRIFAAVGSVMVAATWMPSIGNPLARASADKSRRASRLKLVGDSAATCRPVTSPGLDWPPSIGTGLRPVRASRVRGLASGIFRDLTMAADGLVLPFSYLAKARGPPPSSSPASTCDRPRVSRITRISWGVSSISRGVLERVLLPRSCRSRPQITLNRTPR